MFSSRTLADRNNDPYPIVSHSGTRQSLPRLVFKTDSRKPRPEFQHGVLPENPILLTFREQILECAGKHSVSECAQLSAYFYEDGDFIDEPEPMRIHAHRVLTLLSKIGANQ